MGYTHYFKGLQPNEDVAQAVEQLAYNSGVSIKGWDGICEPRFYADVIDFNGDEELGEDYETFRIERGYQDFNFTKTGRMPYDKVVCAILIFAILSEAEGYENIRSDGGYDDWANSGCFDLYQDVIGELSDGDMRRIGEVLGWN